MRSISKILTIIFIASVITGCALTPEELKELEEKRSSFLEIYSQEYVNYLKNVKPDSNSILSDVNCNSGDNAALITQMENNIQERMSNRHDYDFYGGITGWDTSPPSDIEKFDGQCQDKL